jgi:hypothetical protein
MIKARMAPPSAHVERDAVHELVVIAGRIVDQFARLGLRAAMDLLNDLKAGGYKIVFMKPKYSVTTIASYDEAILKQKGPVSDGRPTSSVVRTISE